MPILLAVTAGRSKYDNNTKYKFEREFSHRCGDKNVLFVQFSYAHGSVVRTWERNGYHDSDFYAEYLGQDGEFHIVEYASTRYPCIGDGASVDATAEVKEKYRQHKEEQARQLAALHRQDLIEYGVPEALVDRFIERLEPRHSSKQVDAFIKLLRTKKFRSEFRQSLCQQVISWLSEDNPSYSTPLTQKQMAYLR